MSQTRLKRSTPGFDSRPFGCDWESCKKDFKRRSDLKRHYKIHTNDRPHPCPVPGCGKRFIQRSALVVHSRTHSGEKPHICQYPGCRKRFSDSSSLARHRHVHTGSRHRKCAHAECSKSFCRRRILVKQEQRRQQSDTCNSDSDSSKSPLTPAQPATPQPLQGPPTYHASVFQGGAFQCTPSVAELDGRAHNCYMDEPSKSLGSFSEEQHRFGGTPQQQLLCDIGRSIADLGTINMSNRHHESTEQLNRSTGGVSYSPPGPSDTPHNSPTHFSSASSYSPIVPETCYRYYGGLHYVTYILHNTSNIERPAQGTAYPHQPAQARQPMPSYPGQILNRAVERYSPPTLVKAAPPWYGYGSYGTY